MRKCILLIAAVGFMMSFLLFVNHQEARAQVRPTQDVIYFMSSVEGGVTKSPRTFDPNGQWCVSQGWHESYAAKDSYGAGPLDAVDEVSQWGTPGWDQNWVNSYGNCESAYGDPVELATLGITYSGSNCPPSTPCPSLFVKVKSFVYPGSCNVIEADLFDYNTPYDDATSTGDWKGRLRILHAGGSNGVAVISVAYNTFYSALVSLGTMVPETPADCYISAPHAHQDFMRSTQSNNCTFGWSTAILTSDPNRTVNPLGRSSDWQRWNPNSYVHSLSHSPGVACVVPGPDVANWLLRSGGELDDAGTGTRNLATTGTPVDIAYTCFLQSNWCGTMRVSKSWLVAAYLVSQGMRPIDYFNSQQKSIPRSGSSQHYFWYGPDSAGYYFQFWWVMNNYQGRAGDCVSLQNVVGYWVDFMSYAQITCNAQYAPAIPNPHAPGVTSYGWWVDTCCGLQTTWNLFRGMGGVNPSIPESDAQLQQAANAWVLSTPWATAKPYFDNATRSARNPRDLATLEITANAGNSFDGMRW